MSLLLLSIPESESYKSKLARSKRMSVLNAEKTKSEIEQNTYDLVKLKVELSDRHFFEELNSLSYPLSILNLLNVYSIDLKKTPINVNSQIHFERYDGTQKDAVHHMLNNIFEDHLVFYYTDPIYKQIFKKEIFLSSSIQYYLNLYSKKDAFFYIARYQGDLLGFCSFTMNEKKEGEGAFYGILKKFRGLNLSSSLLNFSMSTLKENGATVFNNEIISSNYKSINAHIKAGFKLNGVYANIVLYPLLNKKCLTQSVNKKIEIGELILIAENFYFESNSRAKKLQLINTSHNWLSCLSQLIHDVTVRFVNEEILILTLISSSIQSYFCFSVFNESFQNER